MSADNAIASNFPIITLSLISGMIVGIAGIFFKLREISKDRRKELESAVQQKVILDELVKKIERLEQIIFKLPS